MSTNDPLTMTISIDLARRLRDVGTSLIEHEHRGNCPEQLDDGNTFLARDPDCRACKVLCEADAAVEAAESLAAEDPTPPAILKRHGLLTTSELAALAHCDIKTVHNHVNAGKLVKVDRESTHLRFTATAARDYVRHAGVSVPAWLDALAGTPVVTA